MATLVPAIDRALRILNYYRQEGSEEYGVSELSRELKLNKSTVHGILSTLCHYQLMERNPQTKKYFLGSGLIELGHLTMVRQDLRAISKPFLVQLMRKTSETVFLSIFEGDSITVIEVEEPLTEMKIASSIGQRIPFCAGCLGKVFLAWMSPAIVDSLLESPGLKQFTVNSSVDPDLYRESLVQVRKDGYALDFKEEFLEGVWAFSAPIFDPGGLRAALTVVGFASRMCESDKDTAIRGGLSAAREISSRLGMPV